MKEWIYKWLCKGWTNAAGKEVANRDLLERVSELDNRLKEEGTVGYIWIPRAGNKDADGVCKQFLDDMVDNLFME